MAPNTKRILTAIAAVFLSGVALNYPQYAPIVILASNLASMLFGVTIPTPGQQAVVGVSPASPDPLVQGVGR
jgi:hypothetical protein